MAGRPPDDPRAARRRAEADRRRAQRRRDVAFWAVITVALALAVTWVVNPGISLRGLGGSTQEATTVAGAAPTTVASSPVTRGVPAAPVAPVVVDTHERDFGLSASGSPAKAKITVPVLMYHRVAPASTATNDTSYNLTVPPGDFRAQMRWLKRSGYSAITQAELFRAIQDGAALPRKPVVLTFDDGYVDATKEVLPVLAPLGYPATFFIITSRIGERAFLDAKQIRRLSAAGMDIGSHTVDHLELPSLDPATRARQLTQSRKTLETLLGHPVRWFCYPIGRNDTASADAVADAGYLLAYTTEGGSVLRADSLTQLPRVRVSGGQSLDSFAASVRAASSAT
jgi:peptidoglycan/xylan/chitin deacetylase (PgdA/CDA1 family)